MPKFGIDIGAFNQSDSETIWSEDGPLEKRSVSAKKAIKSAELKLRRSACQKNPMVQFGYNEYMAHRYEYMAHRYAYMTKVAEVCEDTRHD